MMVASVVGMMMTMIVLSLLVRWRGWNNALAAAALAAVMVIIMLNPLKSRIQMTALPQPSSNNSSVIDSPRAHLSNVIAPS